MVFKINSPYAAKKITPVGNLPCQKFSKFYMLVLEILKKFLEIFRKYSKIITENA